MSDLGAGQSCAGGTLGIPGCEVHRRRLSGSGKPSRLEPGQLGATPGRQVAEGPSFARWPFSISLVRTKILLHNASARLPALGASRHLDEDAERTEVRAASHHQASLERRQSVVESEPDHDTVGAKMRWAGYSDHEPNWGFTGWLAGAPHPARTARWPSRSHRTPRSLGTPVRDSMGHLPISSLAGRSQQLGRPSTSASSVKGGSVDDHRVHELVARAARHRSVRLRNFPYAGPSASPSARSKAPSTRSAGSRNAVQAGDMPRRRPGSRPLAEPWIWVTERPRACQVSS